MIQERLAEYVVSLGRVGPPPEAVAAAKRVTIDWFAALLPGAVLPPAGRSSPISNGSSEPRLTLNTPLLR